MSDHTVPSSRPTKYRPTRENRGLDRRQLLTLGSFAVLAASAKMIPSSSIADALPVAMPLAMPLVPPVAPKWQGHQPGYMYLGASSTNMTATLARTGPTGLHRTYYRWSDAAAETRTISADHAALRLPWISFKPPSSAPGGWAAVSSGRYDADIRARARRYATYAKPVIVTFNHEPHNDSTGTAAEFAAAWTHIHDIMANESNLANIVDVPIIGDWAFNPKNKQGYPEQYITEAVLARCAFLGIDLYQNNSAQGYDQRLGRILSWLDVRGHFDKMIGIGETGCSDGFGTPTGAAWWSACWAWAAPNTGRVAAISYFDSDANNNSGRNWLLTESTAKLAAFKASLASTAVCHL